MQRSASASASVSAIPAFDYPARCPTPAIKKYDFPFRLPFRRLKTVYASLEEAFAAHDHLYVARFGDDNPELKSCALIMMGNRYGGERILDRHNIRSARACLYRAYGAWQHDDFAEAKRWIDEGRALGGDARLDKLARLMERKTFRILFHCDFDGYGVAKTFGQLPGFDVVVTRHLQKDGPGTLPVGQSITSLIPPGPKIDFVLLDDLKMAPVGLGDVGVPVVANAHDNEWYNDILDEVMPDIDLITLGQTSDLLEVGRAFGCPATLYFYHFPWGMPELKDGFAQKFLQTAERKTDLFYSSGDIGHDFYRYKRQDLLPLANLDPRFTIKIASRSFPREEYWRWLETSRFSMSPTRNNNYLSNRAYEALISGSLHLVEEENGFPYLFSEYFHCFPAYRRQSIFADIEKHLHDYKNILDKFRPQIDRFESEFKALTPPDETTRALRYARHLLFVTQVEEHDRSRRKEKPKSKRTMVYVNEYDYLLPFPAQLARLIEQTPPPHWLRRAFAVGRQVLARGASTKESLRAMLDVIQTGLAAAPDLLALHNIRGVGQRLLGLDEDADKSFEKVTSRTLRLLPTDQVSTRFGRFKNYYWINDVRIRTRSPREEEPLGTVREVWLSYAWAHRADIALHQAFAHAYAEDIKAASKSYAKAADFAARAIDLFVSNDSAQRVYLRAAFALGEQDHQWMDIFLQSFVVGCGNDYIFLHDFAAPAIHFMTARRRTEEADKIRADLERFLDRVELQDRDYTLYPEFIPLIYRYHVAHKKLEKSS